MSQPDTKSKNQRRRTYTVPEVDAGESHGKKIEETQEKSRKPEEFNIMSIMLTLQRLENKFDAQQKTLDAIPQIQDAMDKSNNTAIEALKSAENAIGIAKESKEVVEDLRTENIAIKESVKSIEERVEEALQASESAKKENEKLKKDFEAMKEKLDQMEKRCDDSNKEIEENVTNKIINEFSNKIEPAITDENQVANPQTRNHSSSRPAHGLAASSDTNEPREGTSRRQIETEKENFQKKPPVMNILDQINAINKEKESTLTDEQRTRRDYKLALLKEANPKKEEFAKKARRIVRNQNEEEVLEEIATTIGFKNITSAMIKEWAWECTYEELKINLMKT